MIANLPSYRDYKDSGYPWLGELPTHWDTRRAKCFFREVDDRSRTGREELLSVSHLTGVTPRSQKTITMFLAKSNVGHKVCRPNDVVINTLWAWMAALGVSRCTGIVSPAYGVYRPLTASQLLPQFADRLLRTPHYAAEYLRRSTGVNSSRMRLYPEQFLRIPLIFPPPEEQAAIVRFLNYANGRLERAIRAKRKVIALFHEQKQAIVHRAVTHGLDPTVPFKPSGIPSLDQVPKAWKVVRFKTQIGFQEGPGIMLADFREHGVPLLRISCLAGNKATLNGCNYLSPAKVNEKWSHFAVKKGDYLLSASGSTGAVRQITDEVIGAIPYTGIIRLWPRSDRINMEYLRHFMSAQPFADQISMAKSGVGIEHFGPTHLKRMWICLPPATEQSDIVEFIHEQTTPLATIVARLEREIELLREYRTRLVTDVVMGKLDVREAAKHLPAEFVAEEPTPEPEELTDSEDVEL